MNLSSYPVFAILLAFVFYLLSRKKKSGVKEQTSDILAEKQTDNIRAPFEEETEEEYTSRVYNYLVSKFNASAYHYHISEDRRSFRLGFGDDQGAIIDYHVESCYNGGKRLIMFYCRISDKVVPDNKLIEAAEMVNRLNDLLLMNALVLNYEFRIIEGKLIYLIGAHPIIDDYFHTYFNTMLYSSDFRNAFLRVIENNENPALVALEWAH